MFATAMVHDSPRLVAHLRQRGWVALAAPHVLTKFLPYSDEESIRSEAHREVRQAALEACVSGARWAVSCGLGEGLGVHDHETAGDAA